MTLTRAIRKRKNRASHRWGGKRGGERRLRDPNELDTSSGRRTPPQFKKTKVAIPKKQEGVGARGELERP